MDSMDLCTTEDAVQAFLELLVDPMLPAKSHVRVAPSLSQLESVAKQVHAIGLIYNYYHRKQHPQLEFLGFESFFKVAAILRPSLLSYMKLMQKSNDTEVDDLEKKTSLMTRTIMDACNISKTLDPSKDVPNLEGWPISKVSVFLVDSGEENCLLQFSSITQGVWSMIERDINIPNTVEGKHINNTKRIIRSSLNTSSSREDQLLQLACSAVKDVTGINPSDLVILERHVVYSLSKEKTAARFFLMKCNQVINGDFSQFPIRDVIDSLQGPLVKKISSTWTATPVVEYFHLLPYAAIISQWVSRDKNSNRLQGLRADLAIGNVSDCIMIETPCDIEVNKERERSNGNSYADIKAPHKTITTNPSPKLKDNNGSCTNIQVNKESERSNGSSYAVAIEALLETTDINTSLKQRDNKKRERSNGNSYAATEASHRSTITNTFLKQKDNNGSCMKGLSDKFSVKQKPDVKVGGVTDSQVQSTTGLEIEKFSPSNHAGQDGMLSNSEALIAHESESNQLLCKLHTLVSKEESLSQTALKVLLRKRDNLAQQRHNIEDEFTKCEKNIQKILSGGEDEMKLKLESIIECCNELCAKNSTSTPEIDCQSHASPQNIKRKRLAEAVLNIENASQELDSICYINNWPSPTYFVSLSNNVYEAAVTVKAEDFNFSLLGNLHESPLGAKELAALQMLTKLRSMVSQAR